MDWILPVMAEQFRNTDKIWLKARLFSWSDIEELFNAREREEATFSYRHFIEKYVEGQDSSLIKKAFSQYIQIWKQQSGRESILFQS